MAEWFRFRMGNDPSAIMMNNGIQMTNQGANMMANAGMLEGQSKDINGPIQEGNEAAGNAKRAKNRLRDLEGLRASQSFDDSVLLVDTEPSNVSRSASANNKVILAPMRNNFTNLLKLIIILNSLNFIYTSPFSYLRRTCCNRIILIFQEI